MLAFDLFLIRILKRKKVMNSILSSFIASVLSLVPLVVAAGAGASLIRLKIIPSEALRYASNVYFLCGLVYENFQIVTYFFVPCLNFAVLVAGLDLETIVKWWPLYDAS